VLLIVPETHSAVGSKIPGPLNLDLVLTQLRKAEQHRPRRTDPKKRLDEIWFASNNAQSIPEIGSP
jgi:hypothetical protein